MARFIIKVGKDWKVSITRSPDGLTVCEGRQLRRLKAATGDDFPFPPSDDLPPDDAPHHKLCLGQDLALVYKLLNDIRERRPRPDTAEGPGTTELFGRYLFQTLIGEANWERILGLSAAAGLIELALSWSKEEHYLHQLNWEMMHGPTNFLAAGDPKPIAVTRIVSGTEGMAARPLASPPRILFIIGTSLTDPSIRPAAESLGLIEQLKGKRSTQARILQRATPKRMMREMASFRPDVVHFICHGYVDRGTGRGYLEMELDGTDKQKRRYAKDLLSYLRIPAGPEAEGGAEAADRSFSYPPIVVLSACYSASGNPSKAMMLGGFETAPLAAQLVGGGVPIVIGMAGRVSDMACRIFTRRFGEALVEGEPLIKATSEARFTAFTQGASPHDSVDWACPTAFMAEGVCPDYVPAPVGEDDPGVKVEEWVRWYDLEPYPVFCGRHIFFEDFYRLFPDPAQPLQSSRPSVLAAWVNEETAGFGRTRLLKRLTAQAIRDGHVPCLISSEKTEWEKPKNLVELGGMIVAGIEKARRYFSIGRPTAPYQMRILKSGRESLRELQEDPDLDDSIKLELEMFDKVTTEAVKLALQKDLGNLIADARRQYDFIRRARGRAVLLLDEIHEYGDALESLFSDRNSSEGLFGPYGLGTPAEPVPVVVTFSLTRKGSDVCLQPVTQGSKPWIIPRQLTTFDSESDEDMLVYERVLLHPSPAVEFLAPNVRNVPLAINDKVDEQVCKDNESLFRYMLKGMPSRVASDIMAYAAISGKNSQYLKEADDKSALDEARRRMTMGGEL